MSNDLIITIFANRKEEVVKELEKMGRKATRCGVRFSYDFGEPYVTSLNVRCETIRTLVIDVTIERCVIKKNGWDIVAYLQHMENGNVVTAFNGPVDQRWYSLPPKCDHCGTKRHRKETFLVVNAAGDIRQVGSSCLKEYTGIDPAVAVFWAEAYYPETVRETYDEWESLGIPRLFNVERVLGLALESIQEYGYIKSGDLNSTKVAVLTALGVHAQPEAPALEKAKDICSWVKGLAKEKDFYTKYSIEASAYPIIAAGYVEQKNVGYLAFLPVAYDRYMDRKNRANSCPSEFQGAPGDKLTVSVKETKLVTSWANEYGFVNMYRFVDEIGNVYIWKTSKNLDDVEKIKKLQGTVKEHYTFREVKQTVLTRCKVA